MINNKNNTILSVLIALALASPKAECRLGENFNAFQAHILQAYKLAAKTDTHSTYVMTIDPRQSASSPGFGIALTASVKNNKICGELMSINLGTNRSGGFIFATLQAMSFTYEAIGKPLPQNKVQIDSEVNAFSQAARLALGGQQQKLTYPGYKAKIIVSTDNLGDLIVAIVPEPNSKESN